MGSRRDTIMRNQKDYLTSIYGEETYYKPEVNKNHVLVTRITILLLILILVIAVVTGQCHFILK